MREQKPDLVLMVGDILDAEAEDDSAAVNLVETLSSVAPVCFALGNQEIEFMKEHKDFLSHLEKAGGFVLEKVIRIYRLDLLLCVLAECMVMHFRQKREQWGWEMKKDLNFLRILQIQIIIRFYYSTARKALCWEMLQNFGNRIW